MSLYMLRGLLVTTLVCTACGPRTVRVVMDAENNSGQSGFSMLTSVGASKTRVDIDVASSNDTRPQAVHIHEGRCGEIGPIRVGLENVAPDAKRPNRFVSTTEVSLGLDEMLKGTFAINVHDVRDFSLYVSCGQIQ